MVAIAILPLGIASDRLSYAPYIGIPIAGLPEPSPYDTGTAYYRRCMSVNSRAGPYGCGCYDSPS